MEESARKIFFSFKNAFKGLSYVLKRERNFRIELLVAVFVVILMIVVDLKRWELIILISAIFSVLVLELLNTAVERLVNIFRPGSHPYARVIKDIAAASVLLASVGASIVGIIIFWPYIFG